MATKNVRARTQTIKILDLVHLDTITPEQMKSLEAQGLCVMLFGSGGLVVPTGAYDAICDLLGGVE